MRGRTSSVAYVSPTRPPNSVSTSYGVARVWYTIRSASRRASRLSGPNRVPITTPTMKRPRSHVVRPLPTTRAGMAATTPIETRVRAPATNAKISAFLITTSRSQRWYRKIAIRYAAGTPITMTAAIRPNAE